MNTEPLNEKQLKTAKIAIYTASFAITVVVAILFGVKIDGVDFSFLPPCGSAAGG